LAIDTKGRFGKFLRTKRATLTPDRFDLPVFRRRRVAGLRREELAQLVGISPAWYAQLESGANVAVSPALVRRLADILGLSAIERAYFFSLAFDELGAVDTVVPELELPGESRIAADSFDAEIELVLRAHRSLKVQIYSALVHGTVESLVPQLDEARCPDRTVAPRRPRARTSVQRALFASLARARGFPSRDRSRRGCRLGGCAERGGTPDRRAGLVRYDVGRARANVFELGVGADVALRGRPPSVGER
jgi:transcriptional regulator with XRE-family HTH domain